nr:MAG TPA: hypothetical protein [Caudoviricetes sp.]
MNKRGYRAQITRTDVYEIEIDADIWTDEVLERWSKVFCDCNNLEELIEHLLCMLLRYGYGSCLEGFGYVYTEDRNGKHLLQYRPDAIGDLAEVSNFTKGIKVKVISTDEDYDYDLSSISLS